MSGVGATTEYLLAAERFGLDLDDLERIVVNGMKSAFIHYGERCDVIHGAIRPGFAALRGADEPEGTARR